MCGARRRLVECVRCCSRSFPSAPRWITRKRSFSWTPGGDLTASHRRIRLPLTKQQTDWWLNYLRRRIGAPDPQHLLWLLSRNHLNHTFFHLKSNRWEMLYLHDYWLMRTFKRHCCWKWNEKLLYYWGEVGTLIPFLDFTSKHITSYTKSQFIVYGRVLARFYSKVRLKG